MHIYPQSKPGCLKLPVGAAFLLILVTGAGAVEASTEEILLKALAVPSPEQVMALPAMELVKQYRSTGLTIASAKECLSALGPDSPLLDSSRRIQPTLWLYQDGDQTALPRNQARPLKKAMEDKLAVFDQVIKARGCPDLSGNYLVQFNEECPGMMALSRVSFMDPENEPEPTKDIIRLDQKGSRIEITRTISHRGGHHEFHLTGVLVEEAFFLALDNEPDWAYLGTVGDGTIILHPDLLESGCDVTLVRQ